MSLARGREARAQGAGAPGFAGWSGAYGPLRRISTLLAAGRTSLAAMFACEVAERRLFLWLPVFFGAGTLVYFASAEEPGFMTSLICAAVALTASWRARRSGSMRLAGACLAAAFLFAGFTAGAVRTWTVDAPVLDRIRVAKVTGFIETLDDRKGGARLLLLVSAIEGLDPAATPHRIRVTLRNHGSLTAGTSIRATMRLVPPAPPSEPGGYDFSREAFFKGIGAVGSVISRVERIEAIAPGAWRKSTRGSTAAAMS